MQVELSFLCYLLLPAESNLAKSLIPKNGNELARTYTFVYYINVQASKFQTIDAKSCSPKVNNHPMGENSPNLVTQGPML
jgi:hypothetical protein